MKRVYGFLAALCCAAGISQMAGCPQTASPTEYIAGGTGDVGRFGSTASVRVFSPQNDIAIAGGTPVEVNFQAVVTTNGATIRIVVDPDRDATNDNAITVADGLPFTTTTSQINTANLRAGDYFVGVYVIERDEIAAASYATGRVRVNQKPQFFFSSPRDNFDLDRGERVSPRFDVAWTVADPDSVVSVRIFLDPDNAPNGNEILLRESNSQSGDAFSFDLPTSSFVPGTYRILGLVSDGVTTDSFYAPGVIRIRSRLSSYVDLRRLGDPDSPVAGAIFEGFNPHDNAGSFVGSLRDVDGDGFADVMIVAQFGKPQYQTNVQRTGVGESYLVYGRANRFSGVVNLNSTGTLYRGEIFGGVPEVQIPIRPTRGITAFTMLSDWDRDGVRDMAFGVPFTDSAVVGTLGAGTGGAPLDSPGYFRSGAAIVVSSGNVLRQDLGFPGRHVFNMSDFGTFPLQPPNPAPCCEGFYGPKSPRSNTVCTLFNAHLNGEIRGGLRFGCRISSIDFGDQYAETLSSGEFDSLIVSAPNRDPFTCTFFNNANGINLPGAGVVSVYFCDVINGFYPWSNVGSATDIPPNPAEGIIPHDGPFFYIEGDVRSADAVPTPFQGILADVLSPGYARHPGDSCDLPLVYALASPVPRATTRIWGGFAGARIGGARGIDDFNADGLRDIVIGSPLSLNGAGSAFIVLGRLRDLVRAGEISVEALSLSANAPAPTERRIFDGIRVVGKPGDRLGQSIDDAGDFNNDGIADVLIGSPFVNNRRGGAAVFFGSRDVINLTDTEIPFAELPTRGLGVVFEGEADDDLAGARVATAGDVDGDGNDDILIAAPARSVKLDLDQDGIFEIDRTNCGVVYLVYGSPKLKGTISLSKCGTPELPGAVFIGRNSGDFLGASLGDQGDRSFGIASAGDMDGDGRGDLLMTSVRASPRNRIAAGESYVIYGVGD